MNLRHPEYFYLFLNVAFTVYGQIVTKWQVGAAGPMPAEFAEKLAFVVRLVFTPWMLSALGAAFLASLGWMAALGKLPLSHAYPFVSTTFVLVIMASALIFAEPITMPKLVGSLLIIAGITVASQG